MVMHDSFSSNDLEAGLPGCNTYAYSHPMHRRGSCKAMPAAARLFFFDGSAEEKPRHFLDACALCMKPIGRNRDVFMYRGDTPFCSEECRQERIEMDEAMENRPKLSMKKALPTIEGQKKPNVNVNVRAGAVVAG